jgi:hypothetical protein
MRRFCERLLVRISLFGAENSWMPDYARVLYLARAGFLSGNRRATQ